MSSAATTSPSVDKVDGFSRKSVRKAKQKRSQSSSQFRSQGKPIELTPLPLLKGKMFVWWELNNFMKANDSSVLSNIKVKQTRFTKSVSDQRWQLFWCKKQVEEGTCVFEEDKNEHERLKQCGEKLSSLKYILQTPHASNVTSWLGESGSVSSLTAWTFVFLLVTY